MTTDTIGCRVTNSRRADAATVEAQCWLEYLESVPTMPCDGSDVPAPVHVLAIDDDPSVRQMIADYLTDNDIQVTALGSGKDIGDVMARHTIDLLILDLKLPGEDGMQIARSLRAESDVPIIMLTGPQGRSRPGDGPRARRRRLPDEAVLSARASGADSRAAPTLARARDGSGRPVQIRAYRFAGWELNVRLRRLKSPQGKRFRRRTASSICWSPSWRPLSACFRASNCSTLSRLHDDEVLRPLGRRAGRPSSQEDRARRARARSSSAPNEAQATSSRRPSRPCADRRTPRRCVAAQAHFSGVSGVADKFRVQMTQRSRLGHTSVNAARQTGAHEGRPACRLAASSKGRIVMTDTYRLGLVARWALALGVCFTRLEWLQRQCAARKRRLRRRCP